MDVEKLDFCLLFFDIEIFLCFKMIVDSIKFVKDVNFVVMMKLLIVYGVYIFLSLFFKLLMELLFFFGGIKRLWEKEIRKSFFWIWNLLNVNLVFIEDFIVVYMEFLLNIYSIYEDNLFWRDSWLKSLSFFSFNELKEV